MYKVYKDGHARKYWFSSYETARRYARSLVRRRLGGIPRKETTNPPIGMFGYTVRQVG